MSNNKASSSSSLPLEGDLKVEVQSPILAPQDVVDYLSQHPDFFLSHPEVLAQLHVHHQNKGVVSLTQLQIQQYREKIKTLKKQLDLIITNAKRNETIYTTYADVNLSIVKSNSFDELEQALNDELCPSLGLNKIHIYPFQGSELATEKLMPELQQRAFLDKKLNAQGFYFGRLGQNEKQVLFPDQSAESVALVSIGEPKPIALLAIASKDALHFTPDMDTMLLQYLRDFLSFHLPKLL
jgi:uncharacterized protein YigA (DUF484 family)